jgi:hypothetical protein
MPVPAYLDHNVLGRPASHASSSKVEDYIKSLVVRSFEYFGSRVCIGLI